MKTISIVDMTLRAGEASQDASMSFKEKIEVAKQMDRLQVDVLEMPRLTAAKQDTLLVKTIASLVKDSVISCLVGYDETDIERTYKAVSGAAHPRLHVSIPTSTVQMEYTFQKKPDQVLALAGDLVKRCRELCPDVEFSAEDATRSEKSFLKKILNAAIQAGASTITLCDSAGAMLPGELQQFITELQKEIPELSQVTLSVQCSDELSMANANVFAAIAAGVCQIKTTIHGKNSPSLDTVVRAIQVRGDSCGIGCRIRTTELQRVIKQLVWLTSTKREETSPFDNELSAAELTSVVLDQDADVDAVSRAIQKMGYDLSQEDTQKVYEAFQRIAQKKDVGGKELEAIIASEALQVPPTYQLVHYVINTGNIITATAHITLDKQGETLQGFYVGDGPIDASFLAIEQIVGHHFELDDFQIQAVTEGREAMGDAIVKLRSNGKLFSGRGISTDILGASIHAYLSALNKIMYEEEIK